MSDRREAHREERGGEDVGEHRLCHDRFLLVGPADEGKRGNACAKRQALASAESMRLDLEQGQSPEA